MMETRPESDLRSSEWEREVNNHFGGNLGRFLRLNHNGWIPTMTRLDGSSAYSRSAAWPGFGKLITTVEFCPELFAPQIEQVYLSPTRDFAFSTSMVRNLQSGTLINQSLTLKPWDRNGSAIKRGQITLIRVLDQGASSFYLYFDPYFSYPVFGSLSPWSRADSIPNDPHLTGWSDLSVQSIRFSDERGEFEGISFLDPYGEGRHNLCFGSLGSFDDLVAQVSPEKSLFSRFIFEPASKA